MIGIIIGFLAGIISGMGIGGGTILIPSLTIFLCIPQSEAQSINLLFFFPTALIALYTHNKNKNIEKKKVLWIILFGVLGAILGANIAIKINPFILKKLFGFFLILMGFYEIKKRDNKVH